MAGQAKRATIKPFEGYVKLKKKKKPKNTFEIITIRYLQLNVRYSQWYLFITTSI